MKTAILVLLFGAFCSALHIDKVAVTSYSLSDWRGSPVYEIQVSYTNGSAALWTVHRQYEEFATLDSLLEGWFWKEFQPLPARGASVAEMDAYLQDIATHPDLFQSADMIDFLGLNWNFCDTVPWFEGLEGILSTVLLSTLPKFVPEKPIITESNILAPEYPLECYIYLIAFRDGFINFPFIVGLFGNYTKTMPSYYRPDNKDVVHPNADPVQTPDYFDTEPVHFLPGGYNNGQNVRISYLGKNKFHFLKEENIKEWITKIHGGKSPKNILDIGTGNCFSALAYADLFPEARVIGIDLSAAFVRFCRQWKAMRGTNNVEFYQVNAENTPWSDETFDIIHYSYVLHEMPSNNSRNIIKEAKRILKTGGALTGFDVPYWENPVEREVLIEFNTWGPLGDYDFEKCGFHGPEPFIEEYETKFILPQALKEAGFQNITGQVLQATDAVYNAFK